MQYAFSSPESGIKILPMSRKGQRSFSPNTTRRAWDVLSACRLPRFGWRRTSDDDHFALGTLSISEELIIRNRGRHG